MKTALTKYLCEIRNENWVSVSLLQEEALLIMDKSVIDCGQHAENRRPEFLVLNRTSIYPTPITQRAERSLFILAYIRHMKWFHYYILLILIMYFPVSCNYCENKDL